MTARVWSALLLATLAGVLPGCTIPGPGVEGSGEETGTETLTAPPGGRQETPNGSWSLESGATPDGPIVVPAKREITLEIAPPDAAGESTCNSYGGRVQVSGERIRFGKVVTTLIGCEKDLAEPEGRYYTALPQVRAWRVDDSTLILTGPGVELVFRAG